MRFLRFSHSEPTSTPAKLAQRFTIARPVADYPPLFRTWCADGFFLVARRPGFSLSRFHAVVKQFGHRLGSVAVCQVCWQCSHEQ